MAEENGIICMSKHWQHPMLWGHYADKHKGICLGFDVYESDFHQITYQKERLTLQSLGLKNLNDIKEDHLKKMIHTKYIDWHYEKEYRAGVELNNPDPVSGLSFINFHKGLILKSVILGERSKVTRAKLDTVLKCHDNVDVTAFKTRAGFKHFRIEENKLKSAWK